MRAVLPLLALTGALLAGCASTVTVPLADGAVAIPPVHLKLTPEPGWRVLTYREGRDYYKNFRSTNPRLNAAYYHDITVPFLMLERGGRTEQGYRTLFLVDRGSLNSQRFRGSEKIAGDIVREYNAAIDGVEVVAGVHSVQIAGQPYACAILRYPLGFKDGRRFQVEKCFWVRTTGISAVLFSAEYDATEADTLRPEVQRMLQSVTTLEPGA